MPYFVLVLGLVCAGWLAVLGPGYKAGWWGFSAAFGTFQYLVPFAGLVFVVGLVTALRRRGDRKAVLTCLLGAGLAGLAGLFPVHMRRTAVALPFIHDITTDLENPPRFNYAVDWRGEDSNPLDRPDPELAKQQREGYPGLSGLEVKASPTVTLVAAAEVARSRGWDPVKVDPAMGTVEATETTKWWGFKDDVVVRVQETKDGSRVDVRSVSRVGKSDLGLNARRIREYLGSLEKKLDGGR